MVTIIVLLAALSFTMLRRGIAKARAAKSLGDMRQIGVLLTSYATENANRLPPARADIETEAGGWEQLHWFEACLALIYPELEPEVWRDEEWWLRNKPKAETGFIIAKAV